MYIFFNKTLKLHTHFYYTGYKILTLFLYLDFLKSKFFKHVSSKIRAL